VITPHRRRRVLRPARHDAKVFNNKLREWEDYYNYHRPHGGLNGQTPYVRLREKTQTRP